MMDKELFVVTCLVKGIPEARAERAWERILTIREHIEEHLLDSGYHKKSPLEYDKNLCLIQSEVIEFIKNSLLKFRC